VVQGNASLVYDDLHARGGVGLSARYQLSPGSNAYYEWNRSFGTQREWFGRVYVWFDAPPIGGVRLVRARGSGSLRLAIDIHSSGQLAVRDSFNHRIATMAQPIMTRRWVRIEWSVDQIAGQVEVRLFNSENASSPTGTATTPPRQAIGPNTEVVQVGRSGTQPFATGFWTDDPAVGGFGLLGPA